MTTVGVTGHQVLPRAIKRYATPAMERLLSSIDFLMGVSSLAAGADQMFARSVLKLGGRLSVVVPCADYETTLMHPTERQSYRHLLACAHTVERLPYESPSEDAFLAAGQRVVDISDWVIALWDGADARGKGGTAEVVRYARSHNKRVHVLWLTGITRAG